MEFGIPKEVRDVQMRVGLTPAGVLALVRAGHFVYVERDAGAEAGFSDEDFRQAGAQSLYPAAEAYGRADTVLKVTRPTAEEYSPFHSEQTISCFPHLSVASPHLLEAPAEQRITAIACEMIQTVRQPATALINIAHPGFRDELTKTANELEYV
jgi:alanine dehydrogenase